ncbi:hypothetical protein SYNPS1DRAFT_14741 [Syncephalis pseudoplumigaleata]|uniref:Phospholipid/glycerol acyltransferase domain-containing protein n=1 Tax=Syncephalis pseudoplumigaleata TaxID=1712513 RepID=A0A4P9Z0X6_9FUNG|nr:hypothetical protein SYNPS1DRAFT_14741 [Syncephalis pseudoplumigaleata]|eukprot:RKP26064.1 hypothetical protein SYNPS1DRAFT_14741 [Syncephalis pseudoplumigaleata]
MDITFSGDEVPSNESAIVISNHGGLVDFYLVNALAIRKNMISHCSYFAKNSVKYASTPCTMAGHAIHAYLCGMLMIKRNWLQDRQQIEAVFHRIRTWRPPVWVISFLEGTRLTPEKLSQAFLQSRGLPTLHNLLAPRTKGFCETVRQLRGTHVKHVYDLTIAYWHCERGYGHPPSLLRMHTHSMKGQYRFHVHARRYAIADLPEDDRALTAWVHARFQEKDRLLEEWKASWTVQREDVRRIPLE